MVCEAAPASLQLENWYCTLATVCGDPALSEFEEPMITVFVNGAVWAAVFSPSCRPDGLVANVRFTVSGFRSTELDDDTPAPSVTVRVRWMCEGYSWSGAVNEPLAV